MASSIFNTLHQNHLLSITLCKYSSFNFLSFSPFLFLSPPSSPLIPHSTLSTKNHEISSQPTNFRTKKENASGVSSSKSGSQVGRRQTVNEGSRSTKIKPFVTKTEKIPKRGSRNRKGLKSKKVESPEELKSRIGLDKCCKKGDVMGAIQLYDLARREGFKMGQYHYAVLLYLCSSASTGVVQPAKSGSGGRNLSSFELKFSSSDNLDNTSNKKDANLIENHDHSSEIQVSEDIKKYALERGLEIYEQMCIDKVPMNEPTLTAVARMAMSMKNGEMAFDMVKQMKQLGLNPKLRSYGPALSVFCSNGDVDKAFAVEQHMLEHGVSPEEPELEALLQASVEACKGDRVYDLLHKLRASVRKVSPSTAGLVVRWFKSKAASRLGKSKWDKRVIKEAIESRGGGWHGQGWLGKGKWSISFTNVGDDAICRSCGDKLASIDLDPEETENFAKSVASIAIKRDKDSSFQKFQKWLEYFGPFEAVIDGANVGLIMQNRFIPSKINTIANGIRQKLPSKRWPLIVLHNKRVAGMKDSVNKALVEKWKNADSLYATPTGSNDDWYWLYAAIKFKCLIVTNDEMRDHTFQLLGNDFFPKWQERHQVRFDFTDVGPVFHMPRSYSVVIQESENGHWHIPIASDSENESEVKWLCITRSKSSVASKDSIISKPEVKSMSKSFH
ncbi:proteinaceous RNase P 1, chloroplastic/mitochondrial-like isoform X2 [Euphorbia lathyris]|uniref:proteinaceous RNase P 1, chloroplastic/mitochondrial-like isoform X2 n=1 Tax=Euphorbia lathyris TaxID=212925 RepID=UPI003313FFD6